MKNRIALVFLFVSICWALLFLRGMFLQIWPQPRLTELKSRLFETTVEIPARRGMVFDRNGKELAATVSSYSLFADPHLLVTKRTTAAKLAKVLKISKNEILSKIKNPDKRFVWVKRSLSEEIKNTIEAWKIRGIGFIEEPKRVYPQDHLASQVLGFVGSEGQGLEGLELSLNSKLKGQSRRIILPRDARGRPLLADGRVLTDVPDGSDVTLTLDAELQYMLESELERAVIAHRAQSAVGVVLDAQTSEVLAMADVPLSIGAHRNRAITDAFEPGSTFKPFVVAAALDDGELKPNRKIDCEGGRMKVGDHWISEAEKNHKFGVLSVSEILAFSSNVGMAKIALEFGADKLRASAENYGFGKLTGIEFPGESHGIVQPLPWRPHLLSNVGFGQGLAVTPIQMAQAYAIIANGGILRKPLLVKSIRNSESGELTEFSPDKGRRVMPANIASLMTYMLTLVTLPTGTGFNARIPGFPVAGKTGTAQKIDSVRGGYKRGAYISSFAGFVPAHDPRFVIYIAIDDPQKGYYGAQVAAPVFSKVAQFAVRKKGLAPVLIEDRHIILSDAETPVEPPKEPDEAAPHGIVPQFNGLSLREVYQKAHGLPMTFDVHGSGLVARTIPEAGKSLPPSSRVQLYLQKVNE